MNSTLSEMWYRHNLFSSFKKGMNSKGYVGKDLLLLDVQINLLKGLIEKDSLMILSNFLIQKTYYRLLKSIDKGIEYLPDLINNPEQYVLYNIDKDVKSWIEKDNLIFTCKNSIGVFSKTQKDFASVYIDNKYQ